MITIVNPATEEVVGAVPSAIGVDVDRAVRSARRAFDDGTWATRPPADRADALDRLAAALEARTEEAARLVTAEMGMPISSSRQHNAAAPCAILRYYANLARAMDTEETSTAVSFTGRTVVRREPAGVAAVITSWNYPIMLAFSQLAPALAAGCTIVLKPAAATSLSAYILAEAFEAADFPPGVFNLVTGTHQTAGALARHPGVDTVSFSGPTKQGRWIASICGAELKPARLELGGAVRRDHPRRRRPVARPATRSAASSSATRARRASRCPGCSSPSSATATWSTRSPSRPGRCASATR